MRQWSTRLFAVIGSMILSATLSGCTGDSQGGEAYCASGNIKSDFDLQRCGDSVWDGDYEIDSQASIEALAGYTLVDGALTVSGHGFNSLDGLQSLACVAGDLTIRGSADLSSLRGLDNLLYVAGGLTIGECGEGNPALTRVDALSNLEAVDGPLWIQSNPRLANLDGLASVAIVGEFLGVLDNEVLTCIAGLSALAVLGDFLNIAGNDSLPSCAATALRDRLETPCRNTCTRENKVDECFNAGASCWYPGSDGMGEGS